MKVDYESMSDFEINKAVANIINNANHDGSDFEKFFADVRICELENGFFNPCNNPADAWPIIIKNEISVVFMPDEWECHALINNDESFNTANKNPLRAAMIVFLMMSEQ